MMKSWLVTILILFLFVLAYYIDLFGFLAEKSIFYIAFGILVLALAAAGIILGNPFKRDEEDGKNGD